MARPMLPPEKFVKRIQKEIIEMKEKEPDFKLVSFDGNVAVWEGSIRGPAGTIYEGKSYNVRISASRNFPFVPPDVTWLTPISHPNIFGNRVCLSTIMYSWLPSLSIATVIEALRVLLAKGYRRRKV